MHHLVHQCLLFQPLHLINKNKPCASLMNEMLTVSLAREEHVFQMTFNCKEGRSLSLLSVVEHEARNANF